jgi:hypothetical protein
MKRFLPLAAFALASCNPTPAPVASPEPPVEVAVATPQPAPKPAPDEVQAPPPKIDAPMVAVAPKKDEPAPPSPPPMFPFPKGEIGKLLPDVVRPPMPAAPSTEKFGTAPKPRTVSNKLTDPDSLPKLVHSAPPLLTPKPAAAAPTAPPERVPYDLGFGAAAVPARPQLPEAPGIAIKARDANVPPELPPTEKPTPDRASLDDPTSEPGNAVIVTKSPKPDLGIAAFLKVVLPDPFELGEQVKPKLPPMAEPAAAPIVVNPQRMK